MGVVLQREIAMELAESSLTVAITPVLASDGVSLTGLTTMETL